MTGTLALASSIATLDRDSLARLVHTRKPQAANGVADPIGLASELLRPDSITRALAPLDRAMLRVLAAHSWESSPQIADRLIKLGLVGAGAAVEPSAAASAPAADPVPFVALPEVDAALRTALVAINVDWDAFLAEPAGDADAAGTHAAAQSDTAESAATEALEAEHRAGAWFTPALTSVSEAAECLRALQRGGLRLNRSGSVGVAAARDLAERASITSASVSHALRQLDRSGLTVTAGQQLVASADAAAWLTLAHQHRWLVLAGAFLQTLPGPLRDTLITEQGELASHLGRAGEELSERFPLLPENDVDAARQFVNDAEHLGCTAMGLFTPIAHRLLSGVEVTPEEVAAMLPAAAVNVYLQPDLTVLAPGPLDPQSEALLAELTLPEQIGPASMRRITEASLAAAFERGLTPAEARETFERLSFTGVPQPLDYLLTSVAERIGRIVVQEHYGAEGRSRIRVALPALAETVLVDRQLQHLQLTRASASLPGDVTVLFSRLRPDHVVTAFSEARYHASLAGDPAARGLNSRGTGAASTSAVTEPTTYTGADAATELPAESPDAPAVASGGEEQAQPDSAAPDTAAIAVSAPATAATTDEAPAPHPYEALIERVFVAARTEPEAAAFTRRLELAIRDKTPVNVTAESRGQRRTFKLLPVALTDGRLRATDGPAGVERTFPVSMIVSVDPA